MYFFRSSTNFSDLWTTMQHALDKSNNVHKFDIKEIMNSWMQLNHYPIIKTEQHNDTHVKIFVENIDALDQMMWIPIYIQICSLFNNTCYDRIWLMQSTTNNYTIFPLYNEWMILNVQQAGEYKTTKFNICYIK